MRFTPNDLDVLLHHYVTSDPHPREHAPAVKDAQVMWIQNGMLDSFLHATPRAEAWIEHILRTPLPVSAWRVPDRKEP